MPTLIVSLYAVESYKNFIPLRDKVEAGADLVRTITSYIILSDCTCAVMNQFCRLYFKVWTAKSEYACLTWRVFFSSEPERCNKHLNGKAGVLPLTIHW